MRTYHFFADSIRPRSRVAVALMLASMAAAPAQKQAAELAPVWEIKNLRHQFEARDVFMNGGYLYVAGGGAKAEVTKIKMSDGSVAWSSDSAQSYQPSYPVSNGRVVVLGKYYEKSIVGLDDKTGKPLWTIPTDGSNMSAACFADDLVFIGSYDKHLYAIDWVGGKIRWKTPLGNRIWSTPCAYRDLVIVGCYDGFLYAIDQSSGEVAWKIDCGGTIGSNPVVANDLVFIGIDDQSYGEKYDSSKRQKRLLVIDLKARKAISRFHSTTEWSTKIVVSGDEAYFFDTRLLYSFDTKRARLRWKAQVERELLAFPVLTESSVIAAMNVLGHHGEHSSRVIRFDRANGKRLGEAENGGIGIRQARYVQSGDLVVTADGMLSAHKIKVTH